eukprot:UN34264
MCNIDREIFVPSLEMVRFRLDIPQYVAGATLMALGSSAPEIFVSVLDTVFSEADLGLQGVLGSALFNVCIIAAVSAFVAPRPLKLTRNVFIRDFGIFVIAVGLLGLMLIDSVIHWYEAVSLLGLYF